MITLKIITFVLILILTFLLGMLLSPIVLFIEWIKNKKKEGDAE